MATKIQPTFKNTPSGKGVRTFFQNAVGVMALVLPTLALSEDFRNLITNHPEWTWLLTALPVVSAIVTYVQNKLEERKV